MKLSIFFMLVVMMIVSCTNRIPEESHQNWQLAYQNDVDGRPISGNLKVLINAMKKGSPVRVSWGGTGSDGSTWIEFAEPVFTTIMNDTAVVVQFPLSFIQTHYTDPGNSFLKTDPPTGWRAIMATTGNYHQFHYELKTGDVTRIMYARTNMSWFVQTNREDHRPVPDLAPEKAFILDSLLTPTEGTLKP